MNVGILTSLILGVISVIGFIYSIGFVWGSTKRDIIALKKTVNDICNEVSTLSTKITRLETQIAPFWNIIETKLAGMLHSPHTVKYDNLLEKLKDSLSRRELFELQTFLLDDLEETKKNKDFGRALAITLILGRVASKIEETNLPKSMLKC